jgi:hypothetical protein
LETSFARVVHKVFHPTKTVRKMKKMRAVMLVIGLVLTAAAIGTVAGAVGVFQGKPENIEVKSADGSLLISRQGKLIDNIPIPEYPKTRGTTFIRGRGREGVAVGMPPLVLTVGITANSIPGGVRINLHVPTLEEIGQMENEDQKAVEDAIGIIENQKGISIENARAHVTRSPENLEKIDRVELWIAYVENENTTFARVTVDWDSKEITSFKNIDESGTFPLPPEVMMGMEKLNEMRSIAIQDNRIKEITGGQNYVILPGLMAENEGELIFRMEPISYRVIVDLENKRVKSVEEWGLGGGE